MIRYSEFIFPYQFFHFNFEYTPSPYFKLNDWDYLCHSINIAALNSLTQIHALVMMDTHVHILFRNSNYKENFFTQELFNLLQISENSENLVEPITHQSQYLNTYKYIYRNPVQAQLTERCEDYEYSSLSGLLGKSKLIANVFDQMGLIQNPLKTTAWLNEKNQILKYSQLKSLRQPSSFSI